MQKSKNLYVIFLVAIFGSCVTAHSQEISFIEKVYKQVVFNNIVVLDNNWNIISDQELYNLIYRSDTIDNCFTIQKDQFVNTNLIPGSISIVNHTLQFDTMTTVSDSRYLSFIQRVVDEDTGIFKWEIERFRIQKAHLHNNSQNAQNLDSLVFCDEFTSWTIDLIYFNNRALKLDSCHQKFNLKLSSDGSFLQHFGLNDSTCDIKVDSFTFKNNYYFDSFIKHSISLSQGNWKVKNQKLYLYQRGRPLFEVSYSINDKVLRLIQDKSNYTQLIRN